MGRIGYFGQNDFLYAEQGFGDTIQFVRFASLVAEKGAKVIIECQKELKSLIRGKHEASTR